MGNFISPQNICFGYPKNHFTEAIIMRSENIYSYGKIKEQKISYEIKIT